MLSIIIPTFNEERWIGNLLESLKRQTFQSFEVVVSDYNSRDRTKNIALKYGAKVVSTSKRSIGLGRNQGARQASYGILLFMDADCILKDPEVLEKCIREIRKPKVRLIHIGTYLYDGDLVDQIGYVIHNFLLRPLPYTSGRFIMVEKDAFWQINGFDENMQSGEDVDFGRKFERQFGVSSIRFLPYLGVFTSSRRIKGEGIRHRKPYEFFPAFRNSVY